MKSDSVSQNKEKIWNESTNFRKSGDENGDKVESEGKKESFGYKSSDEGVADVIVEHESQDSSLDLQRIRKKPKVPSRTISLSPIRRQYNSIDTLSPVSPNGIINWCPEKAVFSYTDKDKKSDVDNFLERSNCLDSLHHVVGKKNSSLRSHTTLHNEKKQVEGNTETRKNIIYKRTTSSTLKPLGCSSSNKNDLTFAVTDTIIRRIPNAKSESFFACPKKSDESLRRQFQPGPFSFDDVVQKTNDEGNLSRVITSPKKYNNKDVSATGVSLRHNKLRNRKVTLTLNSREFRSLKGQGLIALESDLAIGLPYDQRNCTKRTNNLQKVNPQTGQSIAMGNKGNGTKEEKSLDKLAPPQPATRNNFLKSNKINTKSLYKNEVKSKNKDDNNKYEDTPLMNDRESSSATTSTSSLQKKKMSSSQSPTGRRNGRDGQGERENITQLKQPDAVDCHFPTKSNFPSSGIHKRNENSWSKLDLKPQITTIRSRAKSTFSKSYFYYPKFNKSEPPNSKAQSNNHKPFRIAKEKRGNNNKNSNKEKKSCGIFRSCSPCVAASGTISASSGSTSSPSSSLSPTSPNSSMPILPTSKIIRPTSNSLKLFYKSNASSERSNLSIKANRSSEPEILPLLSKEKTFSISSNSSSTKSNLKIVEIDSTSSRNSLLQRFRTFLIQSSSDDSSSQVTSPSPSEFAEFLNFASGIKKDNETFESLQLPLCSPEAVNTAPQPGSSGGLSPKEEQSNSCHKSWTKFSTSKQKPMENNCNSVQSIQSYVTSSEIGIKNKGTENNIEMKFHNSPQAENGGVLQKEKMTLNDLRRVEKLSKWNINLSPKLLLLSTTNTIGTERQSSTELNLIEGENSLEKSRDIQTHVKLLEPHSRNDFQTDSYNSAKRNDNNSAINRPVGENASDCIDKLSSSLHRIRTDFQKNDTIFSNFHENNLTTLVNPSKSVLSNGEREAEEKLNESVPLNDISGEQVREGSAFREEIFLQEVDIKSSMLKACNSDGLKPGITSFSRLESHSNSKNLPRKYHKVSGFYYK